MNKIQTGCSFVLIAFGMILLESNSYGFSETISAKEIMTQNEDRRKIDEVQCNAVLTTGGKGADRVKEFTWWRKLLTDKVHFNTLTRFHLPAEIRGEGILFLEHDHADNEVLMYLPNFKKIRRVESQQQSSSFMGSELSYSDIATPHLEDYQYQLLREETCPGEISAEAVTCFVIESIPASEAVKERTGTSKAVSWIRRDNRMAQRVDYYNLEGEFFKQVHASEMKQVDVSKNKWMSHVLRVENRKNGRFTLLQFRSVKVNQGIRDALFTQQNLSRAE
jgi:outer membrane lipoprotein-sorting protein